MGYVSECLQHDYKTLFNINIQELFIFFFVKTGSFSSHIVLHRILLIIFKSHSNLRLHRFLLYIMLLRNARPVSPERHGSIHGIVVLFSLCTLLWIARQTFPGVKYGKRGRSTGNRATIVGVYARTEFNMVANSKNRLNFLHQWRKQTIPGMVVSGVSISSPQVPPSLRIYHTYRS